MFSISDCTFNQEQYVTRQSQLQVDNWDVGGLRSVAITSPLLVLSKLPIPSVASFSGCQI